MAPGHISQMQGKCEQSPTGLPQQKAWEVDDPSPVWPRSPTIALAFARSWQPKRIPWSSVGRPAARPGARMTPVDAGECGTTTLRVVSVLPSGGFD
jgi:hypothetical protein